MNATQTKGAKMSQAITKGSEWVHGNTLYPSRSRVLGVLSYESLSDKAKRDLKLIGCRAESGEIVIFKVYGGTGVRQYLPMDVFQHCYFETVEEMIEAYSKR